MRRLTLVIVVVCLAAILLGCIGQDGEMVKPAETELVLSDYPELFEKEVIIVIGSNASGIEIEGADAIVENLFNLTGNMPVIKTDAEITKGELAARNLILVGGADSNEVLEDVYNMTDVIRATDEYPGAGKGVLEILRNPWNEENAMLLVAGSDERGVKAGSEKLEEVQDIGKVSVVVEWNGVNGVFPRPMSVDKYTFVEFSQEISGAPVMVDRPVVHLFDNISGVLEGGNFDINETLVIVIGNRLKVKESGGGGAGGVTPIYTIPSTLNIPLSWKITYLDTDGTVYLRYNDTKIVLESGEKCEKKFTIEWMGHEVVYTAKIENHGFQEKNKIKLWSIGG